MPELVIEGARRLSGEINSQGAKNSVLPILAACAMCKGSSIIHNCPHLSDVDVTIKILKYLGCKINLEGNSLTVDSGGVFRNEIPNSLMREMRSSIIFLGALVARTGSARISLPGGCELGPRPVDMHFDGLRQLGLRIVEGHGFIECDCGRGLIGCNIALSFPSVGATENIMLAATRAKGTTVITNAAREPEIEDLAEYLNKCGARVRGAGSGTIEIDGTDSLNGAEHTVIPDRIASVTYLAAAAATGGDILIKNIREDHMSSVIPVFEETGCIIEYPQKHSLRLKAPERLYASRIIRTNPYPGFPTDAQAPVMAMTTVADGTSIIVENIFESRYKHVGELLRLGADIKVEGRVAIVEGVRRLSGAEVVAADLRGAAALVTAGLCAEGTTKIGELRHIDRGYENIEESLRGIGASVKRV